MYRTLEDKEGYLDKNYNLDDDIQELESISRKLSIKNSTDQFNDNISKIKKLVLKIDENKNLLDKDFNESFFDDRHQLDIIKNKIVNYLDDPFAEAKIIQDELINYLESKRKNTNLPLQEINLKKSIMYSDPPKRIPLPHVWFDDDEEKYFLTTGIPTIIGGFTGVGKTTLAINLAYYYLGIKINNKPITQQFYTLEMSGQDLGYKLLRIAVTNSKIEECNGFRNDLQLKEFLMRDTFMIPEELKILHTIKGDLKDRPKNPKQNTLYIVDKNNPEKIFVYYVENQKWISINDIIKKDPEPKHYPELRKKYIDLLDKINDGIRIYENTTDNDLNIDIIENDIRRQHLLGTLAEIVYIDYAQIIKLGNDWINAERRNQIIEIMSRLTRMAKKYKFALVLISQTNRNDAKDNSYMTDNNTKFYKAPNIYSLSESSAIEQNAGLIITVGREKTFTTTDYLHLSIQKNRYGKSESDFFVTIKNSSLAIDKCDKTKKMPIKQPNNSNSKK